MVTSNKVIIAGEVRGDGELKNVDNDKIESIARRVIKTIGYEQETFHWNKVEVDVNLHNSQQILEEELMQLKKTRGSRRSGNYVWIC